MEMTMYRDRTVGSALMGELLIDNTHMAWTLERIGVQIPASTYRLSLYDSPRFGRLMPMLDNVPGRDYILIHWGNYPENTDGCILVGSEQNLDAGEIYNTKQKWEELYPLIAQAVQTEGCSIAILDFRTQQALD